MSKPPQHSVVPLNTRSRRERTSILGNNKATVSRRTTNHRFIIRMGPLRVLTIRPVKRTHHIHVPNRRIHRKHPLPNRMILSRPQPSRIIQPRGLGNTHRLINHGVTLIPRRPLRRPRLTIISRRHRFPQFQRVHLHHGRHRQNGPLVPHITRHDNHSHRRHTPRTVTHNISPNPQCSIHSYIRHNRRPRPTVIIRQRITVLNQKITPQSTRSHIPHPSRIPSRQILQQRVRSMMFRSPNQSSRRQLNPRHIHHKHVLSRFSRIVTRSSLTKNNHSVPTRTGNLTTRKQLLRRNTPKVLGPIPRTLRRVLPTNFSNTNSSLKINRQTIKKQRSIRSLAHNRKSSLLIVQHRPQGVIHHLIPPLLIRRGNLHPR